MQAGEVMFRLVFVCLFISGMTEKIVDRFPWNLGNMKAMDKLTEFWKWAAHQQ